jgi:hypothetical protein
LPTVLQLGFERLERLETPLTHARIAAIQVGAVLAGLLLGTIAQVLRQMSSPLMDIGAATAPWVSIGFVFAVWATRRTWPLRNATTLAIGVMAGYLFAWLVAYHGLFAVRQSVGLAAGWREAAPWLVLAVPAAPILGFVAARSHRRGLLGDLCLASPLAWSLPEILGSRSDGWPDGAAVAAVIAAVAILPMALASRRDVRFSRVVGGFAILGVLALALAPIVLSQIRS